MFPLTEYGSLLCGGRRVSKPTINAIGYQGVREHFFIGGYREAAPQVRLLITECGRGRSNRAQD